MVSKIDKKSCWYDSKLIGNNMVRAARGDYWPVLEKSNHFPFLKKCLEEIPEDKITLLDIGCGAGELGRVFENFNYTGLDLPNIVSEVSQKSNPRLKYVSCDIYEEDIGFISGYDIIVMNSFLSIVEKPVEALSKVFESCSGFVLIHRQRLSPETRIEKKDCYYGGETYETWLSIDDFEELYKKNNMVIRMGLQHPDSETYTLLLEKVE